MATLLADADYTIGNRETPVATTGRAMDSRFHLPRPSARAAGAQRHLHAVALANNHSGDYGKTAFSETWRCSSNTASRILAAVPICARRTRR